MTAEAIEVLVIVGMVATPTRREIEERRDGEDCVALLDRMCRKGLLMKTRDDTLRGDPNVYRLTAVALGTLGHATLESFQSWMDTTSPLRTAPSGSEIVAKSS